MITYSCSMPNQGSSSRRASNIFFAKYLKLVLPGIFKSRSDYVSHKTSTCGAPLKGSVMTLIGFRNTSELSPVACFVLDPSKFHGDGKSSTVLIPGQLWIVLVFPRSSFSPPNQIYSAITIPLTFGAGPGLDLGPYPSILS